VRLGQLCIDSGVWDVGPTYILIEVIAVFPYDFSSQTPILNMGVDVMRPVYNFEPQYRVTMLTRDDWTKATGAPPAVKGLVLFTDRSKMRGVGGPGLESMGNRWDEGSASP